MKGGDGGQRRWAKDGVTVIFETRRNKCWTIRHRHKEYYGHDRPISCVDDSPSSATAGLRHSGGDVLTIAVVLPSLCDVAVSSSSIASESVVSVVLAETVV